MCVCIYMHKTIKIEKESSATEQLVETLCFATEMSTGFTANVTSMNTECAVVQGLINAT